MSRMPGVSLVLIMGALSGCPATNTPTVPGAAPSASPLPTISPTAVVSPTASPVSSPSPAASVSPQPETSPSPGPTASPQVSAQPSRVARLEADHCFYGLTKKGETAQMGIRAYDAAGQEIPFSQLRLAFSSSQPEQIKVSTTGLLEALVNTGTATITVTELGSGIALAVETRVRASGGGGGGGGGNTITRHDVTADVDYSEVEFEAETQP